MALRISQRVFQNALLAGNVLGELGWEAGRVSASTSALLPYPCELEPPFVPFGTSTLLTGQSKRVSPVRRARKHAFVHLRLWFRVGEEVEGRRFEEVLRQIAVSGRLAITKYINGRKACFSVVVERGRRSDVEAALKGFLLGLELVEQPSPLQRIRPLLQKGYQLGICHFYSTMPYWRAFPSPKDLSAPLLQNELGALVRIRRGFAFIQTVFERAADGWASNCAAAQAGEERALRLGHAGPWGFEGIEANKKVTPNTPLYSVVLRCGVCVEPSAAREALEIVSRPYRSMFHGTRPLAVLDTNEHLAAVGPIERIARMLEHGDVHAPGSLMTEEELAGFVSFPATAMLEDERWKLDRTITPPVPPRLRKGGTQVAWQPYTNKLLPVVIPDSARSRHVSVEGKTGAGKSVSLVNLICGDLDRSFVKGGIVIDLHGELCPTLLRLLPRDWIEKTVYWDPTYPGRVFRYNPFADKSGDAAKRTDDTVSSIELLHKPSEWGGNIAQDTKYYSYLLNSGPGLCLADAPVLVSRSAAGERLRQEVLPHVGNEDIVRFWEQDFARQAPARMQKALGKVTDFLSQASGRMFRQTSNAVDFRKLMDEGYLVLLHFPVGKLGATTADAIASWVLAQVFNAGMERVPCTPDASVFMVWLDEAQRIAGQVTEEAVTQLRKAWVYFVLAVQSRDQMSGRAAIAMRNVSGALIPLNASYDDSLRYFREFGGEVEAKQFLRRPVGQGWGLIDGEVVQLRMLPPRKPRGRSYAKEIIEHSLAHYYLTEAEFEKELRKRKERLGHDVRPKKHRGYDEI